MINTIRAALGVLLTLSIGSPVFAIGTAAIGNEVPSARAAGQGYVGVAGENGDPIVTYVNPAGLTKLKGTQATLGMHWENLHGSYEDNSGNQTKMRSIDVVNPNFAVTQSFMDGKIGTGLSLVSPYGLETHWSGDSPLRYVATNSKLNLIVLSPAVAYQIIPTVSVGLGADYVNLFNAQLEKHLNSDVLNAGIATLGGYPQLLPGAADANSRLSGTAANWGYHAGLMLQPTENHTVGVTYHSKVEMGINGTLQLTGLQGYAASVFGGSNYSTSANTTLFLPQNIQFGYAYKPDHKWQLEADAAWYDWYSNHNLAVNFADQNPTRQAVLNTGNPIPLNWRDAWSFAGGANYKQSDKLQLRGGVWYEPWIEPESAFSPAIMDLTRYGLTAGFGYLLTSALTIDVAYSAVFFHNRAINNSVGSSSGIPGYSVDGVYKNFANLMALNFTYKFAGLN